MPTVGAVDSSSTHVNRHGFSKIRFLKILDIQLALFDFCHFDANAMTLQVRPQPIL